MRRSAGLLGFAADARVLIVNCDDFGMHPAINAAVIESIEQGIARSCSLMVPAPAAAQAVDLLRDRPEIPFGIHLTLVCEHAGYRWPLLTAPEAIPSLLDETGEVFAPTPGGRSRLLGQARLDEVEVEFRAQIDAVADTGLTPTHLDFHCLADGGRADILDLTVALADEYGLATRVWLDPARAELRGRGVPVTDNAFLDSFALDVEGKSARYVELLRALPPGLTEWAVHPGLPDTGWAAIEGPGARVRSSDYEFLVSPMAREVLAAEHITVIDYRPIREAWRLSASWEAE